jgi:hypothetical protein
VPAAILLSTSRTSPTSLLRFKYYTSHNFSQLCLPHQRLASPFFIISIHKSLFKSRHDFEIFSTAIWAKEHCNYSDIAQSERSHKLKRVTTVLYCRFQVNAPGFSETSQQKQSESRRPQMIRAFPHLAIFRLSLFFLITLNNRYDVRNRFSGVHKSVR